MKLEICTNSYQSAINAQKAGANRIELCSELSVGGISPSYGLLQKVTKAITITKKIIPTNIGNPTLGNFSISNPI